MCGPTASGKSHLADDFSEALSTAAILIDSMQVYREIPVITNQSRRRPAKLSGIISVSDEWSVAKHRAAVHRELHHEFRRESSRPKEPETSEKLLRPFVLDAGTGMYLNASILDIPLAPSVPSEARESAIAAVEGEANPRRASRAKELEMSGGDDRGSIWGGELLFDAEILYVRPELSFLEDSIRRRSKHIASFLGSEEASVLSDMLSTGVHVSKSVLDSIGVVELLSVVRGELPLEEARERINIRTRRLAKRQMRWFDKLASTLEVRAQVRVLDPSSPTEKVKVINTMHDIISSWNH